MSNTRRAILTLLVVLLVVLCMLFFTREDVANPAPKLDPAETAQPASRPHSTPPGADAMPPAEIHVSKTTAVAKAEPALRGKVVTQDWNAPVPVFRVILTQGGVIREMTADPYGMLRGEFEFAKLDLEGGTLVVSALGCRTGEFSFSRRDVEPEADRLTCALEPDPYTIQGIVVDGSGAPVSDAKITIDRRNAPTFSSPNIVAFSGADGHFFLSPNITAPVTLVAWHEGFGPGMYLLESTQGAIPNVRIVLGKPAALRGCVRFAGQPVGRQRVWVRYLGCYALDTADTLSEEDGNYEITGLYPGVAEVQAIYKYPLETDIEARLVASTELSSGRVTRLDFDMPAGSEAIQGVVLAKGEPVKIADVWLEYAYGNRYIATRTYSGDNGKFTLNVPAPLEGFLCARDDTGDGFVFERMWVEVRPGDSRFYELELMGGGSVSGRVHGCAPFAIIVVLLVNGSVEELDVAETIASQRDLVRLVFVCGQGGLFGVSERCEKEEVAFTLDGLKEGEYTIVAAGSKGMAEGDEIIYQAMQITVGQDEVQVNFDLS